MFIGGVPSLKDTSQPIVIIPVLFLNPHLALHFSHPSSPWCLRGRHRHRNHHRRRRLRCHCRRRVHRFRRRRRNAVT